MLFLKLLSDFVKEKKRKISNITFLDQNLIKQNNFWNEMFLDIFLQASHFVTSFSNGIISPNVIL